MFELYDLEADPHELNNLAGTKESAAVEKELKAALQEWMISSGISPVAGPAAGGDEEEVNRSQPTNFPLSVPMPTDERVLCIPTPHYEALGPFLGFRPADAPIQRRPRSNEVFLPARSEVETDPSFKQLIPYVVLRHGTKLFHYRRGKSGTETRLRALRSVGIGGHISEADAAGGVDPYRTGMLREVTEEVQIGSYGETFLGFISDDRTAVGSVHLGVVHLFELDSAAATPREDALACAGFAEVSKLWNERSEFETWSQFVLKELQADLSSSVPLAD